ncbi:MAG: 1-acyl-sn-glycerol-3-phosphate acyltransferase [Candidatus Syntrophonatronum acetioxidans]|uniref:1-acyl-sn-glycerol-3-phosphate acyltransferase n=1 Tax=Candidatus Syntrophonatronum acetioxidans TaxID=1795816 RepID=A0A424YBZ4_9FIRM|nr:MAG: 1-acyl-sn-glycerol-3-phosphate acyltransferase [Candidatus Syntrophonatronum acetioxidans]
MFYVVVRGLFRLIYKIFFRLEVTGAENVPVTGPVILCSNHISWMDPTLMGCVMERRIHYMAKEELFENFVSGFICKKLEAFPVKRTAVDRRALKIALQILKQGKVLALFPEGTRSKTGKLRKPLPGAGFIALKSGSPVVPAAIKGPYKLFRPLKVSFGPPLTFDSKGNDKGKSSEVISLEIMQNIANLLDQKYDFQAAT